MNGAPEDDSFTTTTGSVTAPPAILAVIFGIEAEELHYVVRTYSQIHRIDIAGALAICIFGLSMFDALLDRLISSYQQLGGFQLA